MRRTDLRFAKLLAVIIAITSLGCGGSTEPEVMTDQDELSQWVADNPAPEEIPLDDEF